MKYYLESCYGSCPTLTTSGYSISDLDDIMPEYARKSFYVGSVQYSCDDFTVMFTRREQK